LTLCASLCAASSSYLLGDQLTGVSTADAYRRQLLQVLDVSALHAKQPPHFCDPWSHSNAVIWRWTAGTKKKTPKQLAHRYAWAYASRSVEL
jgi:hypothetical protein